LTQPSPLTGNFHIVLQLVRNFVAKACGDGFGFGQWQAGRQQKVTFAAAGAPMLIAIFDVTTNPIEIHVRANNLTGSTPAFHRPPRPGGVSRCLPPAPPPCLVRFGSFPSSFTTLAARGVEAAISHGTVRLPMAISPDSAGDPLATTSWRSRRGSASFSSSVLS